MADAHRRKVLVVDDRDDLVRFCERVLANGYDFVHVTDGLAAERMLDEHPDIAALLLDRDFSRADPVRLVGPPEDVRNEGLTILRRLRANARNLPVIMVTGFRERKMAVEVADLDADFLAWQDITEDPHILRERLAHAIERSGEREARVLGAFRSHGIVGSAPSFRKALLALHQAAMHDAPVLLLGETGTGKDVLAFAVHALSGDSGRPFVNINVASLSPALIENELFGHVRGAFTGADRDHPGRLRMAAGGSLFLNEIADLPLPSQAKLLTAIERKEVVPVGDVKTYPVDFRLISATAQDLRGMVAAGGFRRDLFHRLAWHQIEIPPLRERTEDIPELVRSFLHSVGQGREGGVVGIAREAVEYLCDCAWDGNVRQLRAVVESSCAVARYMVTLADVRQVLQRNDVVTPGARGLRSGAPPRAGLEEEIGVEPAGSDRGTAEDLVFGTSDYRQLTASYYRYLDRVTGGRTPEVARLAGIAKATAYEWKDKYGVTEG